MTTATETKAVQADCAAKERRLAAIGAQLEAIDEKKTALIRERDPLCRDLAARYGRTGTHLAKLARCSKMNMSFVLNPKVKARK